MVLVLALGVPLVAYGAGSEDDSQNESSSQEGAMSNPLLADWDGPFGGVPPFEGVTVADFEAALEAAMAQQRAELDAIASNKKKASFENTIAAMEDSGRLLSRVMAVYGVYMSTMSTPELRELSQRMAPKLAAEFDAMIQNEALFARIADVHDGKKFAS